MLDNEIVSQLHQVVARMARESDQILLERFGVGLAQYKILSSLHASAKTQQRALAVALGQTEASISRQIKILEGLGMLVSSRNPENRREHRSQLSVKGLRVIEAAEQSLGKYHASVLQSLSKKQRSQLEDIILLLKP